MKEKEAKIDDTIEIVETEDAGTAEIPAAPGDEDKFLSF